MFARLMSFLFPPDPLMVELREVRRLLELTDTGLGDRTDMDAQQIRALADLSRTLLEILEERQRSSFLNGAE